jgi:hypothetical protein
MDGISSSSSSSIATNSQDENEIGKLQTTPLSSSPNLLLFDEKCFYNNNSKL